MRDIGISCIAFLFTLGVHILLHRMNKSLRNVARFIPFPYITGILIVLWSVENDNSTHMSYPVVSIMIYMALSFLVLIFYYSLISLGGVPPSSVIIGMFRTKSKLTETEIMKRLTNSILYDRRIVNMKRGGWIKEQNGRYIVTGKGKIIIGLLRSYEKFFGWTIGG